MSSHNPFISVIMPFYNVADYLREAVESVRNQSYSNWELILIDDGSVDGSSSIAKELVREDSRVICVSHEHHASKGSSASRNRGLFEAKGDYIAFLDSDDVWVPDKLEHQVHLLNRFPSVGMICGASLYWAQWSDSGESDWTVEVGCEQNALFQPRELVKILYPLEKRHAPSMNGLLVKRTIVEDVNGFIDTFEGMYDDQAFLTKIYLSCQVYVTDKIYDKYRQNRPGSVCYKSKDSGDYYSHRGRYLRWLKMYLIEQDIQDQEIDRRLRRERLKCDFPRVFRYFDRADGRMRRMKRVLRRSVTRLLET